MADNEYAGSAFYAEWVYTGGTVTMSGDQRNFTWTPAQEFIDSTAGADTYRRRLESFKDATATIDTLAQTDGTALVTACEEGTNGTLTFGEAGTTSGYVKTTMPARAMGVNRSAPYNDVVSYSVTWQANGDVTYATW